MLTIVENYKKYLVYFYERGLVHFHSVRFFLGRGSGGEGEVVCIPEICTMMHNCTCCEQHRIAHNEHRLHFYYWSPFCIFISEWDPDFTCTEVTSNTNNQYQATSHDKLLPQQVSSALATECAQ